MSPSEREKYTSMFWNLASEHDIYTSMFKVLSKKTSTSYTKLIQVSPSEPK